jgi:peptidoglycan hydrolase-like protein with peptidoglycan-binding domain
MATTLSKEQRAWLNTLGEMVGDTPSKVEEEPSEDKPKPAAPGATKKLLADEAPSGDNRAAVVGFSALDIPGELVKELLGPLSVTGMINNNTELALKLDSGSVSSGEYKDFPPSIIKGGDQSAKFTAVNKTQNIIFAKIHTAGVEGIVRFLIDEQKTTWVLHFNNPRVGDNTADARIEGPNAAQFETPSVMKGGGGDAKFLYILNRKGAAPPSTPPVVPPPGTDPKKDPAPAGNVPSSCLITVVNETKLPLKRAHAEHDRGDFMVPPPNTIPPGGSVTFSSVETPGAKEQGCKGFVVWEVGSPMSAAWRIEWDNPEGAKNVSTATLTPQGGGFASQNVMGQGEDNVPVSFTLSGGGGGGGGKDKPAPKGPDEPPIDPVPEDDDVPYEPPEKSKEPTLRKGDKSTDGWVEYAQMLLNFHLKSKLEEDGKFGGATHAAVLKFQQKEKLQVDGTIGNQTWAALREGAPEKPSTDGREPHTFVEEGGEARWTTQDAQFNIYLADDDEYFLTVESVGDTPIDPATEAVVHITPPGGKAGTVKVALGEGIPRDKGDGAVHVLTINSFRKRFPSKPANAKVTDYQVEGYLPKELGGDSFKGKVKTI